MVITNGPTARMQHSSSDSHITSSSAAVVTIGDGGHMEEPAAHPAAAHHHMDMKMDSEATTAVFAGAYTYVCW